MSETIEVMLSGVFLVGMLSTLASASRNEIGRLRREIFQIQGKLDALLAQAGVKYEPRDNLSPEVRDAVERGKKIEAIKLLRDETQMGLAEAKAFIEKHMP